MKKLFGYQKGVDLGGWLLQGSLEKNHLDTFITEKDCKYLIWAHLPKQLYFDTKSITVVLLKVTLFLIFFLGITLSQQAN